MIRAGDARSRARGVQPRGGASFELRGSLPGGEIGASEVDYEGYRSGDRVFDLVILAFGLTLTACPAPAQDRLWEKI